MPTAKHLAMRDVALAALLGVTDDSDFGVEFGNADFGSDFGDMGADIGADFGDVYGEFGADFGDDIHGEFGADFGAAAPAAPMARAARPTAQAAMAAWASQRQRKQLGMRRKMLLQPNMGSEQKIGKYVFSISQTILIGTAATLTLQANPDVTFRPQRLTLNSPVPGFAYVQEVKVANVSITVGPGASDAFSFAPVAVGMQIDAPTLSPAQRASVLGLTTTLVPPGYIGGSSYIVSATFTGPAEMVS